MNLTLKLIEPLAVTNQWPLFAPGFRKVLEHSTGDQTEATIYNDLASGRLFMMMAMVEDRYSGFATGRIDAIPGGKTFLTIVHTYIKADSPKEVLMEGHRQLEEFGRKRGCNAMRFYTVRDKAFERKFKEVGWKVSYTEMVKDIGGG